MIRYKARSFILKLGTEFGKIVDFPVEYNAQPTVASTHRLKTACNINDGKPALRKMNPIMGILKQPFAVRAAMLHSRRHGA